MSMLEVLIATGVMLVIALSILPLLLRSLANNNQGAEATQAAIFVAGELDTRLQLPFDRGEMRVIDGLNERVDVETQALAGDVSIPELVDAPPNRRWADGEPDDPNAMQWRRSVRLRQFSLVDLQPDAGTGITSLDSPLPGGTNAQFVHLKEIEVRVETGRQSGISGVGQDFTVRVLKAF